MFTLPAGRPASTNDRRRLAPLFPGPPLLIEHLRAGPGAVSAYLALKLELAARFGDDREAYAAGKSAFIDHVVSSLGGPPRPVLPEPGLSRHRSL
jgi:hypothetical protein